MNHPWTLEVPDGVLGLAGRASSATSECKSLRTGFSIRQYIFGRIYHRNPSSLHWPYAGTTLAAWLIEAVTTGGSMLAIIALVLFVLWLGGFAVFHATTGFIHLLLVLALISIVLHLVRGRSVA